MQNRAILGHIDLIASEHRFDAGTQIRFFCQLDQKLQRFVSYEVLRIVEVESGGIEREPLSPLGILSEESPKRQGSNEIVVRPQSFPSRALGQRQRKDGHAVGMFSVLV